MPCSVNLLTPAAGAERLGHGGQPWQSLLALGYNTTAAETWERPPFRLQDSKAAEATGCSIKSTHFGVSPDYIMILTWTSYFTGLSLSFLIWEVGAAPAL